LISERKSSRALELVLTLELLQRIQSQYHY
jgi:hypothetical protein